MCSQKTGSACGTSGSRELCGSRVPDERAARLQAAGFGTIDVSLSSAESGTRHRFASAAERTGSETHAVRVSAVDGDVGAGRNAGQSQACVPVVPDLGSLGGTFGAPFWLNNRGQVVGASNLPGDQTFHPFLWDRDKLNDWGTLGEGTPAPRSWLMMPGKLFSLR